MVMALWGSVWLVCLSGWLVGWLGGRGRDGGWMCGT